MTTTHKGVPIYYTDQGIGDPLVLLHGFIENSAMWDDCITTLTQKRRVICIDLLGHGKSGCTGYIHTMEEMAQAIHSVIEHLALPAISIIGHSMGGYVGCAFAKANKMAKKQYTQLIRMSFSNLFDSKTKMNYEKEIALVLDQALQTPKQGYIAANSGMRLRKNYSEFWIKGDFIKGMILGENDWIIDSNEHRDNFENYCDYFQIIPGGHMSHIGEKAIMIQSIANFLAISTK